VCAAVAVPLLLGVASGCAGGTEGAGTDRGSAGDRRPSEPAGERGGTPRPRHDSDGRGGAAREVVSVRLVVSGGIAGTHQVYAVRRDDTGGTQSPRVARILALAADLASSDLAAKTDRSPAPCCDIPVVDLTTRYADGTRTHIRTAQTTPAPPELGRLVTLMSATS
jgi:hypothetical protein